MALALAVLAGAYGLWVLFIAVMALRWAWYRLSVPVRIVAAPLVLVAFAADLVFNLVASIPLAEWPQEATFSQRMGRYKSWAPLRPGHWRVRLAQWVCANLLDPFEIGGHCRG